MVFAALPSACAAAFATTLKGVQPVTVAPQPFLPSHRALWQRIVRSMRPLRDLDYSPRSTATPLAGSGSGEESTAAVRDQAG